MTDEPQGPEDNDDDNEEAVKAMVADMLERYGTADAWCELRAYQIRMASVLLTIGGGDWHDALNLLETSHNELKTLIIGKPQLTLVSKQ